MINTNSFKVRLERLKILNKYTLLLNPADNIPICKNVNSNIDSFAGLYIPDDILSDNKIKELKIGFGVRDFSGQTINSLLSSWNKTLNSYECTLRPLSGMHSLNIILSVLKKFGNKILILPEVAGGHFSTPKILESFDFEVMPLIYNNKTFKVDIDKTVKKYKNKKPNFLLIDRSDGLFYEDFTELLNNFKDVYSIFDASHYLTHIISNNFKSPFDMGFDLITTSLHKNFPGPQKAMIASKDDNNIWQSIKDRLASFVSSPHSASILCASEILLNKDYLKEYSQKMLENKKLLETALIKKGFNVIQVNLDKEVSNHIWIEQKGIVKDSMKLFRDLEFARISTNYRKFPFNLGDGIRLGTSGATSQGLDKNHIEELANIIHDIAINGRSLNSKHRVKKLMDEINNKG